MFIGEIQLIVKCNLIDFTHLNFISGLANILSGGHSANYTKLKHSSRSKKNWRLPDRRIKRHASSGFETCFPARQHLWFNTRPHYSEVLFNAVIQNCQSN